MKTPRTLAALYFYNYFVCYNVYYCIRQHKFCLSVCLSCFIYLSIFQ